MSRQPPIELRAGVKVRFGPDRRVGELRRPLARRHRGLGRAVQLLEVNANRAVEGEQFGPDRLTGREGNAHARKSECIHERAVHQDPSDKVERATKALTKAFVLNKNDALYDIKQDETKLP